MAEPLSDRFFRRGADFLGCKYPFICGAMTWVSEPKLVAEVCNRGGFACLAGGNSPVDILEKQIAETRRLTNDKPFGLNLITIAPAYESHMQMARRLKLPFVVFAGSFPKEKEVAQLKETGAKVLCFASTMSIADRMRRYGADALVLEGSESGGHIGHVSLTILLQQVLFNISEIPIFVAGGVATSKMCAHLFLMGAAGVQLGTRFAVATESCAHAKFKDFYLRSEARDAVSTPQFDVRLPVVRVRALRNRAQQDFGKLQLELIRELESGALHREQAQKRVEEFWMGALRRAVIDGDIEGGSCMAGQSVGLVTKVESVADILADLVNGTEAELQRAKQSLA